MRRQLLIYANYEVASRYKRKMDKYFLIYSLVGTATLGIPLILSAPNFLFYILASVFFFVAVLSYWSRDSMLKDVQNGILQFRFTPEGWYRNERPVLYRWEDFERVEFADRSIIFLNAKQHGIQSSEISPMLMTDSDFDKVDRWVRQHIPAHMNS